MAKNALELIETMKDLPAMPTVIVKALGIIKNDSSGTKELGEIMAYDQALTSQVLKLVNSAYYGFAQEITSINKALALLGMNQTRNIIIAVAMKPMLTSQGGKELWKHALKTGVACEHIASETDAADAGDAFTIGFLHDIGKIGIPQKILCKPDKLTDEEYELMKSHPARAEKMLMGIKKLTVVSNWLRAHHERWDGKGYPYGLKGEEIPISGRIIALADTYDAMTSTRSYRKALPHETAIEEIKRCAGTQFDPVLAELFVKCSEEIKAAKEDPETYYPKYSYLQKQIYETR